MAVALRELEQRGPSHPPVLRLVDVAHGGRRPPSSVFWLRRLVVLVALIGLLGGGVGLWRAATAVDSTGETIAVAVVIPQGGTLWDLAVRYAPDGTDHAAWVAGVAAQNDLDLTRILPGTVVSVPVQAPRVTASPYAAAGH